jgi:hypothetical protein
VSVRPQVALFVEHREAGLRQVSHTTAKNRKLVSKNLETNSCRRSHCGGYRSDSPDLGPTHCLPSSLFAMPTPRNLAGAPPSVNNIGGWKYPNGPARRLLLGACTLPSNASRLWRYSTPGWRRCPAPDLGQGARLHVRTGAAGSISPAMLGAVGATGRCETRPEKTRPVGIQQENPLWMLRFGFCQGTTFVGP